MGETAATTAVLFDSMKLTEKEATEIEFDEEFCSEAEKVFEWCLIGRFLSVEEINTRAMKNFFRKVWNKGDQVSFYHVCRNTYIFKFPNKALMDRIASGGPWVFDGSMLMLKPWRLGDETEKPKFETMDVWIQVHQLPIHLVNEEAGRKAVRNVGMILDSDPRVDSEGLNNHVRVRVRMALFEPLPRGVYVNIKGERVWLDFKYERIPHVCKWCGIIDHYSKNCDKISNEEDREQEPGYGAWMLFYPLNKGVQAAGRPKRNGDGDPTEPSQKEGEEVMGEKIATDNEEGAEPRNVLLDGNLPTEVHMEEKGDEDMGVSDTEHQIQKEVDTTVGNHNTPAELVGSTQNSDVIVGEKIDIEGKIIPPRPSSPKRKTAPELSPMSQQVKENNKRNKQLEMERKYLGAIKMGKTNEGTQGEDKSKALSASKTLNARMAEAASQSRQAQ